jgi:hypothetical protein
MRLIPDLKFRVILFGIAGLHFLVAYIFEVNRKLKFFNQILESKTFFQKVFFDRA